MSNPETTPKTVWVVTPSFAMATPSWPAEIGPEDDLVDVVERAMEASPISEAMVRQETRPA